MSLKKKHDKKVHAQRHFSFQELEELLLYFSNSIIERNSEGEVLWDVAKNCIAKLGFIDCVIYFIDKKRECLVQQAACGGKNPRNEEIFNPIEIPLNKGITGTVATTGIPEIVSDTSQDSRYIVDDEPRLSEITVPIIINKEVVGVIDCEHPKKNFFTEQHLRILVAIASICSVKLSWVRVQKKISVHQKQLLQTQQELMRAKLQALRTQMNPHFIFNSLNAIQDCILAGKDTIAVHYLGNFSLLLRKILNNHDRDFISLKEEVEFLELYLKMESMRFKHSFTWEIYIDEFLDLADTEVPPMLIHPLIENALKYELRQKENQVLKLSFLMEDEKIVFRIEHKRVGTTNHLNDHSDVNQVISDKLDLLNKTYNLSGRLKVEQVNTTKSGEEQWKRIEISLEYR